MDQEHDLIKLDFFRMAEVVIAPYRCETREGQDTGIALKNP
jgi:hypothetical protein